MHQRPNTLEQIDADEEKLIEVKKHSFGIISAYLQTAMGFTAIAILVFMALPTFTESTESAVLIGTVLLGFVLFLALGILGVATYIYRQSRVIVTDRNITQILQSGLFNRKVSQLNIVNVEDVTSVQHGLVSTALNYGILRIETAGEQSNFEFTYCPNLGFVAKLILDAREKMLGQMDDSTPADVASGAMRMKHGGGKVTASPAALDTAAHTESGHVPAQPAAGESVSQVARNKRTARSTSKPYVANADDVHQVKSVGGSILEHSKHPEEK